CVETRRSANGANGLASVHMEAHQQARIKGIQPPRRLLCSHLWSRRLLSATQPRLRRKEDFSLSNLRCASGGQLGSDWPPAVALGAPQNCRDRSAVGRLPPSQAYPIEH